MHRTVEDLSGVGRLLEGEKVLGNVRYRVHVSKRIIQAGNEQLDGLGRIEGTILSGDANLIDVIMRNAEITLELSDGRRWDCLLQNTNGRLVNRDGTKGLYRP